MPLIEVLPTRATIRPSHGWTYIADTANLPAQSLAAAPSRKRPRASDHQAQLTATSAAQSSKQEKALQARLNDLNRENHKDTHIALPKRAGGEGRTKARTPNVRRILAYNRTFAHYLADEEAGVQVYPHVVGGAGQATKPDVRRKGAASVPTKESTSTPLLKTGRNAAKSARMAKGSGLKPSPKQPVVKSEEVAPPPAAVVPTATLADVEMTDAPAPAPPQPATQVTPATPTPAPIPGSPTSIKKSPMSPHHKRRPGSQPTSPTLQTSTPPPDATLNAHPLLRTLNLPRMPSERVMAALLAEPPLSWTAARAKALDPMDHDGVDTVDGHVPEAGSSVLRAGPRRVFCATCGYWGKVRCRFSCGERVCGLLECVRGHEGVCALRTHQY